MIDCEVGCLILVTVPPGIVSVTFTTVGGVIGRISGSGGVSVNTCVCTAEEDDEAENEENDGIGISGPSSEVLGC